MSTTLTLAGSELDALEKDRIYSGDRFKQWGDCAEQLPMLFQGRPGQYNHASKDTRFVYMVSPGRQPVPMKLSGSDKWPGEDTNESDLKVGPEYIQRKITPRWRAHKLDFPVDAYHEIHAGPNSGDFLEVDAILDTIDGAITQDAMVERLTKGTTYTGDLYKCNASSPVTEVTGTPSWIYDVVIDPDPGVPYYPTVDKLEKGTAVEIVAADGTTIAGRGIVTAPDNSTDASKRGIQFRLDAVAEITASVDDTYTIRLWRRSTEYFPYSIPDMIGESNWPLSALGDSGPTIAELGRLGKSVVVTPEGSSAVENDWDVLIDTIEDRSATFRRMNAPGKAGEVAIVCDKETRRRFVNRQREKQDFGPRDKNDILSAGMELYRDGVGIKAVTPWSKGLVCVFETSNMAYGTNLNRDGKYVQPAPIFVYPGNSTFGRAAMGLANISETYPTGSIFMFNSYSNTVHDRSATGRGENFNLSAA